MSEENYDWLPLGNGVRLLGAHPCGLIALEKPPGVLSHPNPEQPADRERALLIADYDLKRECYHGFDNAAGPAEVILLHRLDSATSGVILLATNEKVADAVRARFQSNDVEKTYFAICKGMGNRGMHGLWMDMMEKDQPKPGGPLRVMPGGHTEARTKYFWMRPDTFRFGMCLLKLVPQTGRTHQLRFQCGKHNFPIVGDRIYGNYRFNHKITKVTGNKRLYLHAVHIKVKFPFAGEVIRFGAESPLPPEFEGLLGKDEELKRELTRRPTAKEIVEKRRQKVQDSLRYQNARKIAMRRKKH